MSIPYERIVAEDLNIGHGTVDVTMPAGGSATGAKIGLHTFSSVFNVRDFGAAGDGTTDDRAAIQAAIDAAALLGSASPGTGGVVLMPPALYLIKNALIIPQWVTLKGAGIATTIAAASSFPTATALITLGKIGEVLSFGARLENFTIDCRDIVNSIGVESTQVSELGGVWRVNIQNWRAKGIYIHGGAAQNYTLHDLNLACSTNVNSDGIGVDIYQGGSAFREISDVTVTCAIGPPSINFLAGIRINGNVGGNVEVIHVEHATNALLLGDVERVIGLNTANVNSYNCTNTILISSHITTTASYGIVCINTTISGGTVNILVDQINGLTVDSTYSTLPIYSIGTGPNLSGPNLPMIHNAGGLGFGVVTPRAVMEILTTSTQALYRAAISAGGYTRRMMGHVTTTDATVTALFTLALDDTNVYTITATIAARRTNVAGRSGAIIAGLFIREGGGATQIGSTTVIMAAPTYTIAFAVSGNNVIVQVTGTAGHTVGWLADVDIRVVNS